MWVLCVNACVKRPDSLRLLEGIVKANSGGKRSLGKIRLLSIDVSSLSSRTWEREARIWTVAWRQNLQFSFPSSESQPLRLKQAGAVKAG